MHAPRAVHACTFFNDNVDDNVNFGFATFFHPDGSLLLTSTFSWRAKKLRFANRLKYQPHLIAGEVARSTGVARAL